MTQEDRTIAHDGDYQAERFSQYLVRREPLVTTKGRDGYPRAEPFRACGYCGSIHPLDLLRFMSEHPVTLDRADMKYGWPHKFYVHGIPSPIAGQIVKRGENSQWDEATQTRTDTDIMGPASAEAWAKFYSVHLKDLKPEQFDALAAEISKRSDIVFENRDGELWWRRVAQGVR